MSPGTSVSTVSNYGLDEWAIEVRSLAEAKRFYFSLYVQNGPGAHPASCPMGTRGPFHRGKAWPGCDTEQSPHLVQRS
jgi:hypothetical protein